MKRTIIALTLCLSSTIALGTDISDDTSVTASNEEQLHNSLGNWYLIDPNWEYQARTIIDTDPNSRPAVQRFMMDRAGISASAASRADRFHIDFTPGSSRVGDASKRALEEFVSTIQEGDRVFVLGFTDTEGGERNNRRLAARRSAVVAGLLSDSSVQTAVVHEVAGPSWLTGKTGRRAEVWVLSKHKK